MVDATKICGELNWQTLNLCALVNNYNYVNGLLKNARKY